MHSKLLLDQRRLTIPDNSRRHPDAQIPSKFALDSRVRLRLAVYAFSCPVEH